MIIIRLMGGLGNQMQQYALYSKFRSLGREVYLDTSWFDADVQAGMKAPREMELRYFPGADFEEATPEQIRRIAGGSGLTGKILRRLKKSVITEERMYYDDLFERDDLLLEGYWAAELYYADILPELREKYSFDESRMNPEMRDCAARIRDDESSVAIHIRRGDYLDPENVRIFGGIATDAYYRAAISYICERVPAPHFYVFSDDIDGAMSMLDELLPEEVSEQPEKNILSPVDINHGADSLYDIHLMSLCRHHICANSTFSFWGARLGSMHGAAGVAPACDPIPDMYGGSGQGIAIDIRPTIQKNTQVFVQSEMFRLWPGWTFIDPEGNVY